MKSHQRTSLNVSKARSSTRCADSLPMSEALWFFLDQRIIFFAPNYKAHKQRIRRKEEKQGDWPF